MGRATGRAMWWATIAGVILALPACGDSGDAEVDFGGEDIGPDRFAVVSESGNAKMGLTEEWVYFGLSDQALEQARAEMEEDTADGLGGAIAGVVKGAVSKAISFRARYAIEDIRDIRWENGEMVIEFTDPDRRIGRVFEVDDRPVTEAFSEQAVREFAEEFHRVKRRTEGRGGQ